MPIPKIIHVVRIGDEPKPSDDNIRTWAAMNPGYEVRLWGHDEVRSHEWFLTDLINHWGTREIDGAADILRWEILFRHGGLAFAAESACVRPLEDWLLQPDCFAAWDNEILRPGLMATGAMGFSPHHFLVGTIIKDIAADPQPFTGLAWQKLGSQRLTDTVRRLQFINLTVYPSHYFRPKHHTGLEYTGSGPVFARQDGGAAVGSQEAAELPVVGASPIENPSAGPASGHHRPAGHDSHQVQERMGPTPSIHLATSQGERRPQAPAAHQGPLRRQDNASREQHRLSGS